MLNVLRITCLPLLVLFVGCGRGEPTLVPLEGQIYFRDAAVDAGTVVFTPDAERGNTGPIAWAEIQPDGRFRLRSDTKEGVVPGWHRVTIAGSSKQRIVPAHYRDPERSGLLREIKPGQPAPVELRLD